MKDIRISKKRIYAELKWLLYSLIFASVMIIYTSFKAEARWEIIIASLHKLLILSLVIYMLLVFIRGLANLIIKFGTGKKTNSE